MGKVAVRESLINGLGVFALRNISEGEMLLAIDDTRVVTPELPLDYGEQGIPPKWLDKLFMRAEITDFADKLFEIASLPEDHDQK